MAAEHDALLALAGRASWLTVSRPRLDDRGRVCFAVDLAVAGRTYRADLRYPATFPHSPPSVMPADRELWSGHQYGTGGELCLEFGPDNWTSNLAGADMVESAERLLRSEAPVDGINPPPAPSRHALTLGQTLRSQTLRFVVTEAYAAHMDAMPPGRTLKAKLLWRTLDEQHTLTPVHLEDVGGVVWTDPSLPKSLWDDTTLYPARVFRVPGDQASPRSSKASDLDAALVALGYDRMGEEETRPDIRVLWSDADRRLVWFGKEDGVVDFSVVEAQCRGRLPEPYQVLADRSVGLVGCGSAGSKIATALARAGVGRLVLVDDDLLLPENLVRNDLDWSSVGEHKVRGVARRADLVSPGVKVELEMKRLAGQEANSVADSVLQKLQGCDLIIDATADPNVFNLLAGVAASGRRPLIWLEVYAGGIGGLVARSRPGLDPSPQVARARIKAWCDYQGVAPPRVLRPYEAESEATPLVADDADVTVIAAHAARMALDLLTGAAPSAFPASAYMIGLREEWIFAQPFHTHRIDLGAPEPTPASSDQDARGVGLLAEMLADYHAQS